MCTAPGLQRRHGRAAQLSQIAQRLMKSLTRIDLANSRRLGLGEKAPQLQSASPRVGPGGFGMIAALRILTTLLFKFELLAQKLGVATIFGVPQGGL